jgi:hypothetical protein
VKDSRLTTMARRGLTFPAKTREQIRKTGIRCRPQLEIVSSNVPMNGSCVERSQAARWRTLVTMLGSSARTAKRCLGFSGCRNFFRMFSPGIW